MSSKYGGSAVARTIRDASLETRAARARLEARGKPYYRAIEQGLHLGYRKPKGRRGQKLAGSWVFRLYIGNQAYRVERFGTADDFSDADGVAILSFKQAQNEVRARMVKHVSGVEGGTGSLTVRTAVENYPVSVGKTQIRSRCTLSSGGVYLRVAR